MTNKMDTFLALFFGLIIACAFGMWVMSIAGVDFNTILRMVQHNVNPSALQFGV